MLNALLYSLLGGSGLSPFGGCNTEYNSYSNYQCQPQYGYPESIYNPQYQSYYGYPNYTSSYNNCYNPFLNSNCNCYPQDICYSSCDCDCNCHCDDKKKKKKKSKSKDKKKSKCNSCNCNNCNCGCC